MDLKPVDRRDLGGVWVLNWLRSRLGIDAEPLKLARKLAQRPGPKLDVALLERIVFALVAGRAIAPSDKLDTTRWIPRRSLHPGADGG